MRVKLSSSWRIISIWVRCLHKRILFLTVSLLFLILHSNFMIPSKPHWSVRIDFKLVKIDDWSSSDNIVISVDSVKKTSSSSLILTSNICGRGGTDSVNKISANFTHTSTSMSLIITTSISTFYDNYDKSFGIYDLFILIDYVSLIKKDQVLFIKFN